MKEVKMEYSIISTRWPEYELIDSGGFEKLERFGKLITRRPEPQAVWKKHLSESDWESYADASFVRDKNSPEKGVWSVKSGKPEQWVVEYKISELVLKFRLGLTAFKHIGLFPEQCTNWEFIYEKVKGNPAEKVSVLNLFAYTGAASLAAKSAGADVVHLDSVKQVINWSMENQVLNKLDGIRWVVEDALKFVKREKKRGNKYHGIILDPPAYGRGPDGEKWILEDMIDELIETSLDLLYPKDVFYVLNMYSMGLSALVTENLCKSYMTGEFKAELGELVAEDVAGRKLPLGTFYRLSK